MEPLLKYRYSFLAGACAAGGSFFGKLPSFLSALYYIQSANDATFVEFCLVHFLPVGLMLCCNVANLRYFLKALQTTQQTLTATVLTAASNYIFSFLLGGVVYQEPLTSLSGVGLTFLLTGLWFLCDTSTDSSTVQEEAEVENKIL